MFTVTLEGADPLIVRLSDFPNKIRSEIRPRLKQGGDVIAADMRRRLSGKSKRIGPALYVRPSFAAGPRQGVTIGVNLAKAPHGKVHAKTSTFRHPVPGTDKWVSQEPINYWSPAIKAKLPEARRLIEEAVHAAARQS